MNIVWGFIVWSVTCEYLFFQTGEFVSCKYLQFSLDIFSSSHSYWHFCLSSALGKGDSQGEPSCEGSRGRPLESCGPRFISSFATYYFYGCTKRFDLSKPHYLVCKVDIRTSISQGCCKGKWYFKKHSASFMVKCWIKQSSDLLSAAVVLLRIPLDHE